MNWQKVKLTGRILPTACTLMLALLASAANAREYQWKPHRIAQQESQPQQTPRQLSTPTAAPIPRAVEPAPRKSPPRQLSIDELIAPTTSVVVPPPTPAVQASTASRPAVNRRTSQTQPRFADPVLQPIPASPVYRRDEPQRRGRGPARQPSNHARLAEYQSQPYAVQPWHPHPGYAGGFSGPRVARHEPIPAGPEEVAPGEILDPNGFGPEGYGPNGYGPNGYGPNGYGPNGYGPNGYGPNGYGPGFESGNCGEAYCGEGCCADCCGGPWTDNCPQCDPGFLSGILYASASLGVEGFKGPTDFGLNGNFGFSEMVNFSGPALCGRLGYQFGFRFVQTNFNGDQALGFRDDRREQTFFTAALYHRAWDCCPWQFGIALDVMRDHYWYKADLSQLRIEISRRIWCNWEFGTLLTFGTGDDADDNMPVGIYGPGGSSQFEVIDQYTVFLRHPIGICGDARLYAGASGNGGGILGGDVWTPISNRFALSGNFGYLFANENTTLNQQQHDAYGIAMNFVWYPYCRVMPAAGSRFRSMFSVANNGLFFVDFK